MVGIELIKNRLLEILEGGGPIFILSPWIERAVVYWK